MIKELEALKQLKDLTEYLTRVDYVTPTLRQEVKELLIKAYQDSNGLFTIIEKALKRNEPMKPITCKDSFGLCPCCKEDLGHKDFCPNCGQKLDRSDEK